MKMILIYNKQRRANAFMVSPCQFTADHIVFSLSIAFGHILFIIYIFYIVQNIWRPTFHNVFEPYSVYFAAWLLFVFFCSLSRSVVVIFGIKNLSVALT